MSTKNTPKIDLIAQMLAKAESTNPAEAEALMAAAEKLMLKLGIDEAVVQAHRAKDGQPQEKIITQSLDFRGNIAGEQYHIASSVCHAWGSLRVYKSNSPRYFHLHIVGFESDVRNAVTIINSLLVQATVAMKAWWKENRSDYSWLTPYDQDKARRGFVQGFGTGAGERIRTSRAQVVEEAGTGTELVLFDRSKKVNEFYDTIPLGKGRARGVAGMYGAQGAGQEAGRKANIGGNSVTQGRGISA